MEVVVTEEKKKIFRARKTMKMSDRQQLESLHSTLLTAAPGLSNPSSPPLMNGTHKDDGQKVGDKDQNNISDSNSPHATSPVSPAPFLSLRLSPSPSSSQSPKAKEETPSSPTSPFHSINFELKKMVEEEKEKKGSLSPSINDPVSPPPTESKGNQEKDTEMIPEVDGKEEDQPSAKDQGGDSAKTPVKALVPQSPEQPPAADCTEPMDTDTDTTKATDTETATATVKDDHPSSPKSVTSTSSASCPSAPRSAPSSGPDPKPREEELKTPDIKVEKDDKADVKKGPISEGKTEEDAVKVEPKEEKKDSGNTRKPSRPSSTPPSNAVKEEKGSTSGLKRTLSEGSEKDGQSVKREGKRPKVERGELEAKLEFKITAKGGGHHKLEKIVQQLVEKHLKVLEMTVFDKGFQELKDRVDKIECTTKHQTAINSLQAKISRLAKKFGEANQASENKRKQEALAAAAATAAAAAAATAATSAASISTAVKTVVAANNFQVQRVLRRQTVEPRPEVVSSVGKMSALSVGKVKAEEEPSTEEDIVMSRHMTMAKKLSDYSEGRCRADVSLRTISAQLEKLLYYNCKRSSGKPRADRYASYIFRSLVPYDVYCDWVAKVNYNGLLKKDALPKNLRRIMRMYIERRFPVLSCDDWREIRDVVNEILRVKRKPEFFQECNRASERAYIS